MKRVLILGAVMLAGVGAAHAQDASVQSGEKCFPAKDIVKFYKKMSSLKAERQDTLEAEMSAQFVSEYLTMPPPNLWVRSGGIDSPFTVAADGNVSDFHAKVKTLSETAELCGKTQTLEGQEPRIGLSMDNDVLFKNRTGPYSLAELQDGVEDGKSFYKKIFGGAMAMFVPKMTHVLIEYLDEDTPLDVSFTQEGQPVASPPVEIFGGTFFISLEDIEASGADTMMVDGGPFKLSPTPSVKKLKSLGFTEDDEDENDEDKAKDGGD